MNPSPPVAEMREAAASDLDDVAALFDAQTPGAGARWRTRMRWQTELNPCTGGRPFGIVLRDGGRCVGHYFVIPQPVWVAGTRGVAVFGLDLFILPEYRGGFTSMNLIRSAHRLGAPAVVATSSANPISEAIWNRLGATPLPGGAVSLILPLRPARLGIAAAARAVWGSRSYPDRALGPDRSPSETAPGGGWSAHVLQEFSDAARVWDSVRERFALATDRSEPFLSWRFGPDAPRGRIVALHDAQGRMRGWYACRLSLRGARFPARVFRVLDLIAAPDDAEAIAACVRDATLRARAERSDLIEARGMAGPFRARFSAAGFRERSLPANPFLVLRGSQPLPAGDGLWHLVAGDGDAGFD